ncbi:MAG: hypothetical protein ACKN9V_05400, partial [Pseudomonadota bacterium]
MKIKVQVLLFILCSLAPAQNLFKFSVDGYPKTTADCKVTAKEVAEKFSKNVGVLVTETKCRSVNLHSYDVDIFYSSEQESRVFSNDKWALYPTLKKCEENLEREKEFFEKTTGLVSFLSYCAEDHDPANNADGHTRFDPTFYGLGEPKAIIKSVSLHVFEGGY